MDAYLDGDFTSVPNGTTAAGYLSCRRAAPTAATTTTVGTTATRPATAATTDRPRRRPTTDGRRRRRRRRPPTTPTSEPTTVPAQLDGPTLPTLPSTDYPPVDEPAARSPRSTVAVRRRGLDRAARAAPPQARRTVHASRAYVDVAVLEATQRFELVAGRSKHRTTDRVSATDGASRTSTRASAQERGGLGGPVGQHRRRRRRGGSR